MQTPVKMVPEAVRRAAPTPADLDRPGQATGVHDGAGSGDEADVGHEGKVAA